MDIGPDNKVVNQARGMFGGEHHTRLERDERISNILAKTILKTMHKYPLPAYEISDPQPVTQDGELVGHVSLFSRRAQRDYRRDAGIVVCGPDRPDISRYGLPEGIFISAFDDRLKYDPDLEHAYWEILDGLEHDLLSPQTSNTRR